LTDLRIENKTCHSLGRYSLECHIIFDVYYSYNCDVEQTDMLDWRYTHGRQLQVTQSPMGCLPWKSSIYRKI